MVSNLMENHPQFCTPLYMLDATEPVEVRGTDVAVHKQGGEAQWPSWAPNRAPCPAGPQDQVLPRLPRSWL